MDSRGIGCGRVSGREHRRWCCVVGSKVITERRSEVNVYKQKNIIKYGLLVDKYTIGIRKMCIRAKGY